MAKLTRNGFPGRTDKGFRIGPSKHEVRDGCGEPDTPLERKRGNPADNFGYKELGM